ncbi:hypothetical protein Tco_0630126, partial [Tanacetum coccineum]
MCGTKVCEEQKQNIEDTMLDLLEICRQKELYCMHNNVEDLIESALNSKLLLINLNSQRLNTEEQEVKNIAEPAAKHQTRITSCLQNFKVSSKESTIPLNKTPQISPVNSVLPSRDDCLEEVNDVDQEKEEFDLENFLQIQDVILREKLLNINHLIANIESLNDNSTPNCVLKSTSSFPIPDSNSFFEKSDTSLSYSDNSLPEFESFSDHTKEMSSGSTTTHANNSLPEYDSFHFEIDPDQGELTNVVMEDFLGEPHVHTPNVLPTHPTLLIDSDLIIRTFLPYFTYPVISYFLFSSGSEDTIFDPGISTFHFSSLKPVAYENPIVIFLFFCFCPKDKGIRGEIPQDHEDPCLFSILQSSGLRSFAYYGILNPDH